MAKLPKDRVYVQVNPNIKEQWTTTCGKLAMDQQSAAERLIEWFVQQEPIVQLVVLGTLPPDPDVIVAAVKRVGKGGKVSK